MEYYLLINGEPTGPFRAAQIIDMLEKHEVPPETPCALEGDVEWKPAGQVFKWSFQVASDNAIKRHKDKTSGAGIFRALAEGMATFFAAILIFVIGLVTFNTWGAPGVSLWLCCVAGGGLVGTPRERMVESALLGALLGPVGILRRSAGRTSGAWNARPLKPPDGTPN